MPEHHNAENAKSEFELAELVGRIGNFYTKKGLSPPFFLRDAAREWHGLSQDEIVAVLEKHFRDYRHLYIAGAGDQHFHLVRSAISKAIEAKHPSRDLADHELDRPRRRSSSRVQKVHNASGFPDVFVEGRGADRPFRNQVSNVQRLSGLAGYERTGVPIGQDDVD
jgi:hypothetical protein